MAGLDHGDNLFAATAREAADLDAAVQHNVQSGSWISFQEKDVSCVVVSDDGDGAQLFQDVVGH